MLGGFSRVLLIVSLVSTSTFSLCAQHIYVSAHEYYGGGWIVDADGQTVFEIPSGWKLAKSRSPMSLVDTWPILFEHTLSQNSVGFAFLHVDQWQVLEGYDNVQTLGDGCFALLREQDKHTRLVCPQQEVLLDNTEILTALNEDGLAFARYFEGGVNRQVGLLNKKGQWVLGPFKGGLKDMGMGCYYVLDRFDSPSLIHLSKKSDEWQMDTVLNIQELGWKIDPKWRFDETGHTWARLGTEQLVVIDTTGLIVSDTLAINDQLLEPFHNGLSWVGKPLQLINTRGEVISTLPGEFIVPPANNRILMQDQDTQYFGY